MAAATKKATTKTQEVTENTQETVNSMISIGQDTAHVALNGMVQTAQVANDTMSNVVNIGLNSQEAGLNIARNYFDNMNRIGKEFINVFSRTSERTIDSVSDIELAIQREANDIAKDVVNNAEKAVDTAQKNIETQTAKAGAR